MTDDEYNEIKAKAAAANDHAMRIEDWVQYLLDMARCVPVLLAELDTVRAERERLQEQFNRCKGVLIQISPDNR